MGFYKNGSWQPDANEIAAGEYADATVTSVKDSDDGQVITLMSDKRLTELRQELEKLRAENERLKLSKEVLYKLLEAEVPDIVDDYCMPEYRQIMQAAELEMMSEEDIEKALEDNQI